MRDLIWTIIIVWLVYRVYSALSPKRSQNNSSNITPPPAQNKKEAAKRSLEKEGDYVDYEEVK